MKLCVLQQATIHGDRHANQDNAAVQIRLAMEDCPDVLVMPEFWDVGYPENVALLADPDGSQARAFLSAQAKRYHVNIVGGAIVREHQGKLWNTALVFNREGQCLASYDKIHLFSYGREQEIFQPGDTPARYMLDGVSMGGVTCYDVRFGELVRHLALGGIKILFVPAMWGKARLEHWQLLLRARVWKISFSSSAPAWPKHRGTACPAAIP